MAIKIGPAGLGGVKDAVENLGKFHELGLTACEIPFTYGVFIKENMHKKEIAAKKFKIQL